VRPLTVAALAIVSLCHWGAQFVAWAAHPGNRPALNSPAPAMAWSVLSFPLFYVVPDGLTGGSAFPLVLAANSLAWGLAAAFAVHTLTIAARR
jgi:hypothetical protein